MTSRRVLAILAAAELLAMAPWFSASAVAPSLARVWQLSPAGTAWLTISVQLGFVAGALVSAILTLADRWSARRLVLGSAAIAALATLGVAVAPGYRVGMVCRLLTGAALAGVYPPGMKIVAGWFREGRGWAIGVMVGALTLGSATPHLVRWAAPPDAWRVVLVIAAVAALAGGLLVLAVPNDGPFAAPSPRFTWSAAPRILRDRAVLLANLGYLGHMWELYAMWTWLAAFLAASVEARGGGGYAGLNASEATFVCVGLAGGLGAYAGGALADRWGRTTLTIAAMALSGLCAVLIGFTFGGPPLITLLVAIVWGVTVIADSAQFSTAVTELAPAAYVGTALTTQTCLGFALTMASIWAIPPAVSLVGWRWAFAMLAIGPALGVLAMARLRVLPEASLMAGGRR